MSDRMAGAPSRDPLPPDLQSARDAAAVRIAAFKQSIWTADAVAGWLAGTLTLIVGKATDIEKAIGVPFPWLIEAREALANYDRWYVSHNERDDKAENLTHSDGYPATTD